MTLNLRLERKDQPDTTVVATNDQGGGILMTPAIDEMAPRQQGRS